MPSAADPASARIIHLRAGDVPLLIIPPAARDTPRGTVLWYHGFGVDKETNRAELERFADAGFIAVGVDVVGHGERRAADLDARMAGTQEDALSSVIEFADATAREIPTLIDYLIAHDYARAGRIALAGISMGAFVVYRAAAIDPRAPARSQFSGHRNGLLRTRRIPARVTFAKWHCCRLRRNATSTFRPDRRAGCMTSFAARAVPRGTGMSSSAALSI